jgi:hypothetical protein
MNLFCKTNKDFLGALVKCFHYSKALHHTFFEMQSGILNFFVKIGVVINDGHGSKDVV